ncbi:MAG: Do family serine endopeptidase [Gemmatimonadales bacterium]|nr:MAG: Do family serine endopeptidase [Gemmatimonadales bacterium]
MFDPLRSKTQVLLFTALAFLGGIAGASLMGWTSLTAMPSIVEQPQVSEDVVAPAVDLSTAFVNIAEAVTPAVVRIEADRPQQTATQGGGAMPEELRRFFNIPPGGEGQESPRPRTQTAGGSGFIVSPDGYILTNDHVVSGAQRIRVFLPDRREYTARLVGGDPTTDVAVLKIEDRNLPTLSFGSSRDVRVGEWVLAVGNPGFGGGSSLDYTVTAGIISAIGRPLQLIQRELGQQEEWQELAGFAIEDFIQTDAVINPGNSGGPMVNVRGQVVGINSAIASRTGFYQGYGFAIPVDLARRVMEDLVEYGQVRRPYLGVSMVPVEPEDAEYYGLPRTSGVLVQGVPEDGPAAAAGIRQEDVIVSVDDEAVERPSQLQSIIAQKRPGDRVRVRFYRDGQPQEITVRLGETDLGPRPTAAARAEPRMDERLGLEVAPLDEEIASQLGYPEAGGVVIRNVDPSGPAARRGLGQGLKVMEINREPVNTVGDVERLLQAASPGDVVSVRVETPQGDSRVVNVRIPG